MEVDGKVRQQEILSKDERDLERIEREEIESDRERRKMQSDERGERKMNKKTINGNGIFIRSL